MLKEYLTKAKEERKRKEKLVAAKKIGTGLAVGTAVGLAAAVLLTPKSGKETREGIAEKATDVIVKGKNVIKLKKEQMSELRAMVKENITKVIKSEEASGKENIVVMEGHNIAVAEDTKE